ncbi:Panacea domain-containing protein [Peribacillus glennii]|uniref:DUF4065 domain-containing protein n=1 Tax=Peribacillus glennii TaxID=2303991 RepID=A0A372L8J2_9BACI|nr:type II toxin-antitoxin system antitoxin SocA domain-containing protein [Peribacillus glennii]RFU60735.1 DUF4065 domain-containing protein [Peribacillus glennii]
MAVAIEAAKFLLFLKEHDPRRLELSNLKLQKLLYYSQGYHLAMTNGEPLFDEPIEAWKYGPVVKEIYHKYKKYGDLDIQGIFNWPNIKLKENQMKILGIVWAKFGEYNAGTLVDMTHSETPWLNAWHFSEDKKISTSSMTNYFKKNLPEELFATVR